MDLNLHFHPSVVLRSSSSHPSRNLLAGAIQSRGERTHPACCRCRLENDFNTQIYCLVREEWCLEVFGERLNTTRQRRVLQSRVAIAVVSGKLNDIP